MSISRGHNKGNVPASVYTNPLHGNTQQSKIDFYQLGPLVKQLRDSGCTLQQIQDEINTKYLTEEGQFVSKMSLSRWINKNLDNAKETDQRLSDNTSINEYNELLEMLEYCNSQLEIAESAMLDLKKQARENKTFINSKDVTNLLNTIEKTLARKQAILASITQIKDKIYSWQSVNDIVRITLDKVKEKDLSLYAEIVHEIKTDPLLIEAYRKLKEIKE